MQPVRTVSRFTFQLLVVFTISAMTLVEVLFVRSIAQRLGIGNDPFPGYMGGLIVVNVFFGAVVVDRALKAIGLSRSGRMVEGRRPADTISEYAPTEDVIEIRCARSLSTGLALMCLTAAGLIFVLSEVIVPKHDQVGREALPALYGMFLGGAALTYLIRYIKIIEIDSQGVTAARTQYSIQRTMVPWSQIASCDLVVVRDTFGRVATAYPILKGADGNELFRGLPMGFAMAPRDDQHKVLRSLKGRFPKLDPDPWDI